MALRMLHVRYATFCSSCVVVSYGSCVVVEDRVDAWSSVCQDVLFAQRQCLANKGVACCCTVCCYTVVYGTVVKEL